MHKKVASLEGICKKISPLSSQTELHLLQVSSSTPVVVDFGSKLQSLQLGHFMDYYRRQPYNIFS